MKELHKDQGQDTASDIIQDDATIDSPVLIVVGDENAEATQEYKAHPTPTQPYKQRTKRLEPAPDTLQLVVRVGDAAVSGLITYMIAFVLVLLCCALLPGSSAKTLVTMSDASFLVAMLAASISCFAAVSYISVLVLIVIQLVQGVYIGSIVFDALCVSFGIDPTALMPLKMSLSPILTFVLTALPVLVPVLYRPLCHVSPLRATVAQALIGRMVGDKRSDKVTFSAALKDSLCQNRFAYTVSNVFTGSRHKFDEWVRSTSGVYVYKRPNKSGSAVAKQREKLLIGYRPFEELERFIESIDAKTKGKERVRTPDTDEAKMLHRGMWFVFAQSIVLGWIFTYYILTLPNGMTRSLLATGSFPDVPLPFEFLGTVMSWLGSIFGWSIGFLALFGLCAACRPSKFELSSKGIRWLAPIMPPFMQDRATKWKDIERVVLELPPGKTAAADARLEFVLKDKTRMSLRIGSIASAGGREEILRAIERWAPDLPRDPKVIQSLQPPADHSYTDIWLDALSAPPQRDRLIPLADGVQLREGQYCVHEEIGSGGQGAAYLADDILAGERVVLKEFLLPVYVDVSVRRTALDRFEGEAKLLKALDHPQVVKLLDFFIEDHRAYLVLEHIEGESLRSVVEREGALDEERVRQLAKQMCAILTYLHSQAPPVVHRDFTPENLILHKDGTLKLIDFNVAQQTDSTVTGTAVGKPAYLPPEQFRGQATPQSDIYAMGACLAYLITGVEPVPISTSRCSELKPDVSADLDELIAEATAPDATLRLKNIGDFHARLTAKPRNEFPDVEEL